MPAEAGIQSVVDINNFKNLDSRFRGNDGALPITTESPAGEGRGGIFLGFPSPRPSPQEERGNPKKNT
jgi:hypothetical protein